MDGLAWELERDARPAEIRGLANPFALGHLVNHPGPDACPNIMAWTCRIDLERLAGLGFPRELIPFGNSLNWYYCGQRGEMERTHAGVPLAGLVMVATRTVPDGGELLFDYQLGMYPVPAWYHTRDVAADMLSENDDHHHE